MRDGLRLPGPTRLVVQVVTAAVLVAWALWFVTGLIVLLALFLVAILAAIATPALYRRPADARWTATLSLVAAAPMTFWIPLVDLFGEGPHPYLLGGFVVFTLQGLSAWQAFLATPPGSGSAETVAD